MPWAWLCRPCSTCRRAPWWSARWPRWAWWCAASPDGRRWSTLRQRRERLPELGDLGRGHRHAVALGRVLREKVLVVRLGREVAAQRLHLGDDGLAAVGLVLAQLPHDGLGLALLLVVAVVDPAAVLRADVVALAVQRGGVVHDEEDLQDLPRADLRRVVGELHHLVVAGAAGAHLLVAGVVERAVGIARLDVGHSAHVHVDGFGAPEAAATQHDG